jgi:rhodanese-related sulfurtransferase
LVCQAGKRSLHAVDLLSRMNINSVAYSLKGGVNGLVDLKWLSNE